MMERKDDFDEHKIITTDYTFEDGYKMILEELEKDCAFDAIFANDVLCMGAMKALLESGVNVPNQVGVVGFDDIPSCAYLTPTLSSVRVDKEALGASAVELLLGKIVGGAVDKVTIGAQLIRRGSTQCNTSVPLVSHNVLQPSRLFPGHPACQCGESVSR